MLKAAYLFAVIDTTTLKIIETNILPDETPTLKLDSRSLALLFKRYGRDFTSARRLVLRELETSPYWRWALDLLKG